MKKLWTIVLILVSITGYTQKRELPLEVKSAFETKYKEARLGSWWELSELYYFDYSSKGGNYTAVFNQQGKWLETAETISEMEVPAELSSYIRSNFPSGSICICEKVETAENQKFLRISILDEGNIDRVIKADLNGNNIEIQET